MDGKAVRPVKLLLLGKDGQVGWELQRALAPLGELIAVGRGDVDLGDVPAVRQLVRSARPQWIVNAAAYTAVDKAETDSAAATAINTSAVQTLAEEARTCDAWLVHYSTDYVFDGEKQDAYLEDDPTAPLSVYGRTKLDGERAIRAIHSRHLILRTSWVYAARGSNFAKTMLRLAAERDQLKVVCDQFGAPTSAELIADVTALAIHSITRSDHQDALAGTYHLAAAGRTTWHAYAQYLVQQASMRGMALRTTPERIEAIPAAAYPTAARRPRNSCLDTGKLQRTFGLALPDWQVQVARLVAELAHKQ